MSGITQQSEDLSKDRLEGVPFELQTLGILQALGNINAERRNARTSISLKEELQNIDILIRMVRIAREECNRHKAILTNKEEAYERYGDDLEAAIELQAELAIEPPIEEATAKEQSLVKKFSEYLEELDSQIDEIENTLRNANLRTRNIIRALHDYRDARQASQKIISVDDNYDTSVRNLFTQIRRCLQEVSDGKRPAIGNPELVRKEILLSCNQVSRTIKILDMVVAALVEQRKETRGLVSKKMSNKNSSDSLEQTKAEYTKKRNTLRHDIHAMKTCKTIRNYQLMRDAGGMKIVALFKDIAPIIHSVIVSDFPHPSQEPSVDEAIIWLRDAFRERNIEKIFEPVSLVRKRIPYSIEKCDKSMSVAHRIYITNEIAQLLLEREFAIDINETFERTKARVFSDEETFHIIRVKNKDNVEQAVGFCAFDSRTNSSKAMHIHDLYIQRQLRLHGLGTALLESMTALCREKGKSFVNIQLRESAHGAISFFLQNGFHVRKNFQREHFQNPVEDAVTLVKVVKPLQKIMKKPSS